MVDIVVNKTHMRKSYYIIGSGGFAKEVYFLAKQNLPHTHKFCGFIDKEVSINEINIGESSLPVIREDFFLKNINPSRFIDLYIGIGNPGLIKWITEVFEKYNFPNLIHSNVIYDQNSVNLGVGNIITAGCTLTVDILIGSFNIFNLLTTVGHDVEIGDHNIFNPGVNVSGSVKIGSRNLFGTNATILQMLEIGNDNLIGSSSLLTKNLESGNKVIGIPAKKII